MNQQTRLNKIQISLKPKQAAILWLQEIKQFPNITEYVNYLRDQPESALPMHYLPELVEKAVQEAMKGRQEKEVWDAVRLGVRDVAFLYYLVLNVNERGMNRLREWQYLYLALKYWLNWLISTHIERKGKREKVRIEAWKESVEYALVELYTYQISTESIADRYFDGNKILFPDLTEDIGSIIQKIERLVDVYDTFFTRQAKRDKEINLEYLHEIAGKQIGNDKFTSIDQAKAEALLFIGESDTAVELIEQLF